MIFFKVFIWIMWGKAPSGDLWTVSKDRGAIDALEGKAAIQIVLVRTEKWPIRNFLKFNKVKWSWDRNTPHNSTDWIRTNQAGSVVRLERVTQGLIQSGTEPDRNGDYTNSLCNLLCYLTVLTLRKFLFISTLYLSYFNLCPFFPPTMHSCEEPGFLFLVTST